MLEDIVKLLNSLKGVNFTEDLDVLAVWAKELPNCHGVRARIAERDRQVVDHDLLRDGRNIHNVLLCDQVQIAVLSSSESDIAVAPDGSSDLDLHLYLIGCNLHHDSDDLAIVEVDHVVGFQESLDNVAADSQLRVRGCVHELIRHERHGGASSDPLRILLVIEVGDSNLSTPGLQHNSACFVWSQPLCLFELIDEFHILFHGSMAQINSRHGHAGIEQLDYLVDLRGAWTKKLGQI